MGRPCTRQVGPALVGEGCSAWFNQLHDPAVASKREGGPMKQLERAQPPHLHRVGFPEPPLRSVACGAHVCRGWSMLMLVRWHAQGRGCE